MSDRPYHHGNLRRALLDSAVELIAERGPASLSLREVARRAGVSHAAPAHHFADKTGLLTAVAAEGWRLLTAALADRAATADFGELGVSYVVFATSHPAHFAVMRTPGLVHPDDPELVAARDGAGTLLYRGAGVPGEDAGRPAASSGRGRVLAAWSLVHGLAVLLQEGLVAPGPGEDIETLARAVTAQLAPA
ncbi:TetR/AcrR family transcriptional regulator [Pseudonocardia asaccharolytica]|uniref:TetR family transcriptional regulator n=1 Tax=Pseudonocardia asaccharolytica DSM 44247 = NBRC 16224 TaxID=1123024 RepID=A0A511D404_9PSEU|nr:TetR/AcrR family transcriptional regulator [Pseudonocardia asaccharolytica]GEL19510.1 TetR family transcriptional regulator [Pseudonocardia asaccharolytica DSM 44247 = NBRC 16224]